MNIYLFILFCCIFYSCKETSVQILISNDLDTCISNCNRIADISIFRKYSNNTCDTVITCDLSLVQNKNDIPINLLVDTLNMIIIDSLTKDELKDLFDVKFYFSDNYICLAKDYSLMLFDKKGHYVRKINIQDGPAKHLSIDHVVTNEKEDRIFVLPTNSTHVIVYDFSGKYRYNIPLVHINTAGSSFYLNYQNRTLTMLTPFDKKTEHCIWIQSFEGKRLQSIAPYTYCPDIFYPQGHVIASLHNKKITYFHSRKENITDFLYHFIEDPNRLAPRFRIKNNQKYIGYNIHELSQYFIIDLNEKKDKEGKSHNKKIILDKKTLKGCAFKYFSSDRNIPLGYKSKISDGYFYECCFLSEIDSSLVKSKINRTRDNLILFIGKLR